MKTKTVNLYTFDELSDKAKEKAREWWRDGEAQDFEPEYEPIVTAAKLLGIEFKQRPVLIHSGGVRYESCIWWTLHVQGAGASFDATYRYAKGSVKAIKAEFPTDEVLHGIAQDLTELEKKYRYQPTVSIKSDSRDHWITVEADDPVSVADTLTFQGIFERLCTWIYKTIDADYSSRMEDEYVDDAIKANEYTFLVNGKRED